MPGVTASLGGLCMVSACLIESSGLMAGKVIHAYDILPAARMFRGS
jgi:hypothetical protein